MKTLYVPTRKEWRAWLSKNHDKEPEVWLVRYNKSSGRLCISYDESVEEALCFGWIDSIQKSNDKESTVQRFTPRRPKSNWSELNKERARRLIEAKQMTAAGSRLLEGVDLKVRPLVLSSEVRSALKKDPEVWKNFENFDELYKRIRIAYIEEAKKQKRFEEFDRRLNSFIRATKKNRKIGTII